MNGQTDKRGGRRPLMNRINCWIKTVLMPKCDECGRRTKYLTVLEYYSEAGWLVCGDCLRKTLKK